MRADPDKLRRVIINLLGNALDAFEERLLPVAEPEAPAERPRRWPLAAILSMAAVLAAILIATRGGPFGCPGFSAWPGCLGDARSVVR